MKTKLTGMIEEFRTHWPFALALLLLAVGLMFISPAQSTRIRLLGSLFTHPFVTSSEALVRGSRAVFCRDGFDGFTDERGLELMEENLVARGALRLAARDREAREMLQLLLRVANTSRDKLHCTRIVQAHGKQSHYEDFVQLSSGRQETLQRHHLVVNDRMMLVGVIEVVGKDWAFMRPTTSPRFSMSVKVPSRLLKGTMTGGGSPSDDLVAGSVAFHRGVPVLTHIRAGESVHPGDQLGLAPSHLRTGDTIWTDSTGDPSAICDGIFVGTVQRLTTDRSGIPVQAEVAMARITGEEFLFVVFPSTRAHSRTVGEKEVEEARR